MPRIDDLLNLIQSANDIYLVNPSRNVRMAYIQIDNLCELVMKSWLQENISDWSPVSHSRGGRDYYKGFWKLADEVIQNNSDTELSEILERIKSRRENRNIFFHNHNLSGLTVNDQQCLGAFCDLYDLTEILFSSTFSNETKANHILRAQIMAVRIKLTGLQTEWVNEEYKQAIGKIGCISLNPQSMAHEYRAIYNNPISFYERIKRQYDSIAESYQNEILRIDALKQKSRKHHQSKQRCEEELTNVRRFIRKYFI